MADLNTVSWKTSKEGHTYRVVRESIGKVGRIEISVVPRGDYHDLGQDPPSWVEMRHFISVRRTAGGSVPYATEVKGSKILEIRARGGKPKERGQPSREIRQQFLSTSTADIRKLENSTIWNAPGRSQKGSEAAFSKRLVRRGISGAQKALESQRMNESPKTQLIRLADIRGRCSKFEHFARSSLTEQW